MNASHLALACGFALLLAACATPLLGPECTRFGRDAQLCLLPPASLPVVEGGHMVKVKHDGREDAFMGLLHIDAQQLRLAGLTLFGTGLFELSFDGTQATSMPAGSVLKPELLVAMLELAIADPKLLQEHLHGLTLEVSSVAGVETRELRESGRLIAHIEKRGTSLEGADIRIAIPPAEVSVEMSPLNAAPVPP